MENNIEVPQNTKNRTTIWSHNFTPGYIVKEDENANLKRYRHCDVHSGIIYSGNNMDKIWKQPKCPSTDE